MNSTESPDPAALQALRDRVITDWCAMGETPTNVGRHRRLVDAVVAAFKVAGQELAEIIVHQQLRVWADESPFVGLGLPDRGAFLGLQAVTEALGRQLQQQSIEADLADIAQVVAAVADGFEDMGELALPASIEVH